jgi:SanA protein
MSRPLRPLLGIGIWFAALLFVGCHLWFGWESEGLLTDDPASLPPGAVAVVLGCDEFDEEDGRRLAAYHPRLDAAARLAAAGRLREIIVSGYQGQADAMAAELRRRGVTTPIVRDPWGWRTIDSVLRARARHPDAPLVFVSQSWHADRAVWQARRLGADARGFVAFHGAGFGARFGGPARELLAKPKAAIDWLRGFPPTTDTPPSAGFRAD